MKFKLTFILYLLFISPIFSETNLLPADTVKRKITKTENKKILHHAPTKQIGKGCGKIDAILAIIGQAIDVGAPTYNEGNHVGCYMIYEGAAYKILHKYGSKCKDVKTLLEDALDKAYASFDATEKAWIMRVAFDQILGEPTVTK